VSRRMLIKPVREFVSQIFDVAVELPHWTPLSWNQILNPHLVCQGRSQVHYGNLTARREHDMEPDSTVGSHIVCRMFLRYPLRVHNQRRCQLLRR